MRADQEECGNCGYIVDHGTSCTGTEAQDCPHNPSREIHGNAGIAHAKPFEEDD